MSHEVISMILQILSLFTSFCAAAAIIVKPIREKLFDTKRTQEGQRLVCCIQQDKVLQIVLPQFPSGVLASVIDRQHLGP